jgi:hypothetical protein
MTAKVPLAALLLCAGLAGCGGQYILTVPDQVAAAGRPTPVVVRLQRSEFWLLSRSVDDMPLRFVIDDGPQRAAYTDALGYAETLVQAPNAPGRHEMAVALQDDEGDEASVRGPVYVWDPNARAVAVDLDALPRRGRPAQAATDALRRIARQARICYFTRRPVAEHRAAHDELAERGRPDGPILLWQRERWHLVRGRWKLPRIVVETRLVSQLPALRERFAGLTTGVCTTVLARKAFAEAGLRCLCVGSGDACPKDAVGYRDWADLAERGLP